MAAPIRLRILLIRPEKNAAAGEPARGFKSKGRKRHPLTSQTREMIARNHASVITILSLFRYDMI